MKPHTLRKVIKVDEARCDGCGLCSAACHENAIVIVNGKARLLRDDYCDGLGACLPACPMDAIMFEEREAAPFDVSRAGSNLPPPLEVPPGGPYHGNTVAVERSGGGKANANWPVQIRLVPAKAEFFNGADLLISADCAAYRHENFHRDFIKNSAGTNVTLIACPKLDNTDYSVKLSEIIQQNNVRTVTLVKMEVPCCGGLEWALSRAVDVSGKKTECRVVTLSVDGCVLDTVDA